MFQPTLVRRRRHWMLRCLFSRWPSSGVGPWKRWHARQKEHGIATPTHWGYKGTQQSGRYEDAQEDAGRGTGNGQFGELLGADVGATLCLRDRCVHLHWPGSDTGRLRRCGSRLCRCTYSSSSLVSCPQHSSFHTGRRAPSPAMHHPGPHHVQMNLLSGSHSVAMLAA